MPKSKKRHQPSRLTRHSKPVPHRRGNKTALMRIKAPPEQSWALTLDEVALVRNHIAKGSTDEELKFCLAVARRRKLDPFKGQIWFVKRRDNTAQGGYRWIPITGIDGLLHLAARDHRDFGTVGKPTFGPMHTVTFQKNGEDRPQSLTCPEWAEVRVFKKGIAQPTEAIVYWDEIYPNIDYAPLVRQMPRLMLGKCAVAQAIRRTYPDTGGLYIPEEMQGPPEFTPGGRIYSVEEPKTAVPEGDQNPHLKAYLDKLTPEQRAAEEAAMAKKTPAQREIVERKMAEAKKPDLPIMDVEYVDPAKSRCAECGSSFGVHLLKCSQFRSRESKSSQDTQLAEREGAGAAGRHTAPQPEKPIFERALTYLWIESDQEALIDGNAAIKRELQQLLGKYVKPPKFEIRVNGDELEALKYELKSRGVTFTRRYPKV